MGAPTKDWSYSDTDETIELHMLGGTLRFGSAIALNIYLEDNLANTPTRRIPMSVGLRDDRPLCRRACLGRELPF
jgi:hypothetical protein